MLNFLIIMHKTSGLHLTAAGLDSLQQRLLPHAAPLQPLQAKGSWNLLQGDPAQVEPHMEPHNSPQLHNPGGRGWKICFKDSTIIIELDNRVSLHPSLHGI